MKTVFDFEKESPPDDGQRDAALPWLWQAASRRWEASRGTGPAPGVAEVLTLAAVVLGVALRLREFLFRRSLWTDEAMLALNVIRRGYIGLTRPLDLLQGAPIGFLWLQRASVDVFGNNEYALRLFPLLAAIASVFLFAALARRLLSPWAAAVVVLLFATLTPLVYYAAEAKQYSFDVAATLLVVHGALRLAERPLTPRRALLFGAAGAFVVLFSHPATLVLASVTAVAGVEALRRRQWQPFGALALGSTLWGGAFLFQYFRALEPVSGNAVLQRFWAAGYPKRPVKVFGALGWAQHAIAGLIPNPIALGHPWLILLLVLAGMAALFRTRWRVAALFVVVAAAALVAATLHLYPLRWRLALFLVPLVLLALAAALDLAPLAGRGSRGRVAGAAVLALIALVAFKPLHEAEHTFRHPTTVTEMRPLLEHVKQNLRPGDIVYVHWAAAAEFEYYQSVLDLPPYGSFSWFPGPVPCDDTAALTQFSQSLRAWVVFGSPPVFDLNDTNARSLEHFDRAGRRIEDRRAPGKAEVALYGNLHPPAPGTPAPSSPHEGLCLHLVVP